jgi:hypothetical protein
MTLMKSTRAYRRWRAYEAIGKARSRRADQRLNLLTKILVPAAVVCIGLGLMAAALLGADLHLIWLGSTGLAFVVLCYALLVSIASKRRSTVIRTQLEQLLRDRRRPNPHSNIRYFVSPPTNRHTHD